MEPNQKVQLPRLSYADIERAEYKLEQVQESYLRERGWNYSSDSPGCYWLWSKEIDGQRWTGGTDLAISMQRSRDSFEPHRYDKDPEGPVCALCGGPKEDRLHG